MPRDKDLKRIIRTRMQKTGEAYTTARAHTVKASTKNTAAPKQERVNYAALGGKSDAIMKTRTGRDWAEWVDVLDAHNAHAMSHGEIARIVHEQYEVDGWWSQSVAVGYERIRGLREIGQRRSGTYEVSKSKTFNVPVDVLFDAWADDAARRRWLTGAKPNVSTATKPRSLRMRWEDGTLVGVWFVDKGAAKSTVTVQHAKLVDRGAADAMKAYWTERLERLREVLTDR